MGRLPTFLIAATAAFAFGAITPVHAETAEECNTAAGEVESMIDASAAQMSQSEQDNAREQVAAAHSAGDAGDYARCMEIVAEVKETVEGATN